MPDDPRATDFEVVGRMRPGVTPEQGRDELSGVLHEVSADRRAAVEEFTERSLGAKLASNAVLLAVAVLLILIAAANLANLRLVENEGRRRETGIRLALGAGRAVLARQHLAETLVLSGFGLLAGTGVAAWLIRLAPALFYGGRTYIDFGIRLDVRTFTFSCAALLVTASIGGLIPLADAWKRNLLPALQGSRSTHAPRWLGTLVVIQMALVTGGACSAALLLRSLQHIAAIRPAMDPDRSLLLVEGVWPGGSDRNARTDVLAGRMTGAPRVEGVAWARRVLLAGSGGGATVDVEMPGEPKYSCRYNQVSPNYFAVTGAHILSGRAFTFSDGPDSTPVLMINSAFARRFLEGKKAPGQWVRINGKDHQVVGVVEDGPTIHLREPVAPYLYFAFAQRPSADVTFFVASQRGPASLTGPMRALIRQADGAFIVLRMTTLAQHMRNARSEEQLAATVAVSLALTGLLLAAAGLFGVTLYAVARRTQEFGVRMALGAGPAKLARQVLREAGLRVALALPIGWGLALLARHVLEKRLYGIAPDDPATLAIAGAVVAAVAAVAALQPALRASRVDPMIALRWE
jgi:putative ABC transport system permease protein